PPTPERSTRGVAPIASVYFNASTYDWVNRKDFAGCAISPSLMTKVPSRVMPVTTASRGCTVRVYQNRVMYKPSFVDLIMASSDVVPGRKNKFIGAGPNRPWGEGGVACPVDCFPSSRPAVNESNTGVTATPDDT